jgi:hypothetical protein
VAQSRQRRIDCLQQLRLPQGQQYLDLDTRTTEYGEEMSRHPLSTSALFVLTIMVAVLVAPSAYADDSKVPPDVARWFDSLAADLVMSSAKNTHPYQATKLATENVRVGEPQVLLTTFTGDEPNSQQRASADQWVAPLLSDNEVIGTVSAWRSPKDGSLELAYFDDNAVTGNAVERSTSDPDVDVANDPLGNGMLVVDSGRNRVTPVELPDRAALTLAQYREAYRATTSRPRPSAKADAARGLAGGAPSIFPLAEPESAPLIRGVAAGGTVLALIGGGLLLVSVRLRGRSAVRLRKEAT